MFLKTILKFNIKLTILSCKSFQNHSKNIPKNRVEVGISEIDDFIPKYAVSVLKKKKANYQIFIRLVLKIIKIYFFKKKNFN